jgi:hypothetical protein
VKASENPVHLENEALTIQEHEDRRREEEIPGGSRWIRRRINTADFSPAPESQQRVEKIEGRD